MDLGSSQPPMGSTIRPATTALVLATIATGAARQCERPETSAHIVLATWSRPSLAEMSTSPWWRLGLSGAKILRYRRIGERPRARAPDPWASECNTSGRELFLPHNRGFDAAALWDYCYQYYDRLPALLVFTHHEVPTDWHTSCEASLTCARPIPSV